MPNSRNFWLIVGHEARVLIADWTLPLALVFLTALAGYGIYNGLAETRERDLTVKALLAKQEAKYAANIAQLRRIMAGQEIPDPFANAADPASIGGGQGARFAFVPTTALAPIAFGQSDMLPNYYLVSDRSRLDFMYDNEIENPWNLLSGHFDLAFFLVYLLPLFIFALSYNLLSAEREHGTLRMLLSQPLSLASLISGKVVVRAGAVLACAALLPALALILLRAELQETTALPLLVAWIVLLSAYGLFWFALSIVVNVFGKSSAANALTLVGSWVVLVLIVPVVLNLAISVAAPAPSRTELATQTRLITIAGMRRYNELLSTDYRYIEKPEMLIPKDGRFEVQPRLQALYLVARDTDAEMETLLGRFDTQLAAQQSLVDRFGSLSPAIVVHEGMAALAGNGSRRYIAFQRQVKAYHVTWKLFFDSKINQGLAITEGDFARIPRWNWREEARETVLFDAFTRILQVTLSACALAGLAFWRLRKYSPV